MSPKKRRQTSTTMSDSSVWYQLYVGNTKSGDVSVIDPSPKSIAFLREEIKKKQVNDLAHCDANKLYVLKPNVNITDLLEKGVNLLSEENVHELYLDPRVSVPRETDREPLVVVAPPLPGPIPIPGETEALERAKKFAEKLQDELKDIDGSDGMKVWENVPNLETGKDRSIVIRKVTEPFWQACINLVDTHDKRYRVCAVGTPGIGKSTSTSVLIRMLLTQNNTVVYRLCAADQSGWYYEFAKNTNGQITAAVYPESRSKLAIPSLTKASTYYIVDPCKFKLSCDPEDTFKPKVIIVSSPNSDHWGVSEFSKKRDDIMGHFLCYPVWELNELLSARPMMTSENDITQEILLERYHMVGGVPRAIFMTETEFEKVMMDQNTAVNNLDAEKAKKIARNEILQLDAKDDNQPKSAIMGYCVPGWVNPTASTLSTTKMSVFAYPQTFLISALVKEKVYVRFMKDLWNIMIDRNDKMMFEVYTRHLMAEGKPHKLDTRRCVGKKKEENNDKVYYTVSKKELGGCSEIRYSGNIINSALEAPNIVFHSLNPCEQLVDFVYFDAIKNHFHAFQATIGETHSASETNIRSFLGRVLGEPVNAERKLLLYYLVPGSQFLGFVTNPVEPCVGLEKFDAFHVSVPDPNGEVTNVPVVPTNTITNTETSAPTNTITNTETSAERGPEKI